LLKSVKPTSCTGILDKKKTKEEGKKEDREHIDTGSRGQGKQVTKHYGQSEEVNPEGKSNTG